MMTSCGHGLLVTVQGQRSPFSGRLYPTSGFPGGSVVKYLSASAGDMRDSGLILWRRKLTPVFLPGKSPGQRSLAGYSPWGCKELNTTERITCLPWWLSWQRICLQCGRPGFDPWGGKIPWRRPWQSTPIFLLGETPWIEEPCRLQSMGSQGVEHDSAIKHSTGL